VTLRLGGEEHGGTPQPYALAHDSELRLLLAYSAPPRAGRITAVNSSSYTVEIADGENATVEAVALDGFSYGVDDVVYVLQAANAPDSGLIVGCLGPALRLGIGTVSPDGPLHVEDANGGFAALSAGGINGTEQTLLAARVGQVLTGDALVADGTNYNSAALVLTVPASSYNAQNVGVGGATVQFRVYANGDLRVVRTAGASTPTAVVRALWV
jgi:hypothetical protein